MAEDTEKKFNSIMEKLFSSQKSNLSLSSFSPTNAQKTRGQKRAYSAIELTSQRDKSARIANVAEAPPCRPWDRGDLIRRLATFKSMTWFAKPKVMDAVSCARRGWVNIDMDIVACEVCGARLQFSTPSSWSREQVEKAALVFSLKLDSGHKLLCPWIDNACDEKLSLFPPTPTPVLVDHYKERSSSLMQLSALPVISVSVLESMKSLQLEHFLKQSIAVECGEGLNGSSLTEYLGNDVEAVSANSYYQAHRILSLCGWEPRLLPYTVDCSDQSKQSANNANLSGHSHMAAGENSNKLSVYMSGSSDSVKGNGDPLASSVHYDPNSTILECKLCGASVGLWAFTTVPKPLELIRLVGYAESDGGDNQARKNYGIENLANNGRSDSNTVSQNKLNLTIAGGPPPKQHNFRVKISLPIIGRNVRARFSNELSQLRNTSEEVCTSHNAIEEGSTEKIQTVEIGSSGTDNLPAIEDVAVHSQTDVSSTGHQDDVGVSELAAGIVDEGSNLQKKPTGSTRLIKETSSAAASGGQEENGGGEVAKLALQEENGGGQAENGGGKVAKLAQEENGGGQVKNGGGEVAKPAVQEENGGGEVAKLAQEENGGGEVTKPDVQEENGGGQVKNGGGEVAKLALQKDVSASIGTDLKIGFSDKKTEFHPIRQHRHFCPWLTSSGTSAPGWQQTLSALQKEKVFSLPESKDSPSSPSLIKVDDPITSIRKLFESPPAKRSKPTST